MWGSRKRSGGVHGSLGGRLRCRGVGQCPGYLCRVQADIVISLAGMGHITMETIAATRQMGPKEDPLLRKLCAKHGAKPGCI